MITAQPQAQTVTTGSTATFNVVASGTGLAYQWYRGGTAVPGANAASYTTSSLTVLDTGASFSVIVSAGAAGSATSDAAPVQVQGIEFVAGSTTGAGSVDGTGAGAGLGVVNGIAVDAAGNAYVADSSNDTIRKVTPAGVVTTLAGSAGLFGSQDGNGASARFNNPKAVAVDAAGTLYVADTGNHTIRRIDANGGVTTIAGLAGSAGSADGQGATARFQSPQGIAVSSTGVIYVADTNNNLIRSVSAGGLVTTLAGSLPPGPPGTPGGKVDGTGAQARFSNPKGLAVDGAGIVYVADTTNNAVRTLAPGAVVRTLSGYAGTPGHVDGPAATATFYAPAGVAVDAAGNVYVADTTNSVVRFISTSGVVSTVAGTALQFGSADGMGAAAIFRTPAGLGVEASGDVLVADTGNFTLRKIAPGAMVTTIVGTARATGSADGTGATAQFFFPQGVTVGASGNAYVSDAGNSTVREITPLGAVTTFAGNPGNEGAADGTGPAASFFAPQGLAIDSAGNLFLADEASAVRKITPAAVVSTVASGAPLSNPIGIAVDSAGTSYISDIGDNTIRKISPTGTISLLAGASGLAGSADGMGAAARFDGPAGLAVDAAGNVYVADGNNQTIRKITPAGLVTTLAGTPGVVGRADGTGAAASFSLLDGIAVDAAGNVYATDFATIRKITPAGVVTTVAGTPGQSGWNGGGALPGLMRSPGYVAIAPAGYLVVTSFNAVVRIGL
jgi:sugar lactone lactonase YvrE